VNNFSFAFKTISETVEAGFIKAADSANISKKYATYIPFGLSFISFRNQVCVINFPNNCKSVSCYFIQKSRLLKDA
jgi:hypothetical protein